MGTNSRKHRLHLFQTFEKPTITIEEAIEQAERAYQWRKIYFRVGGQLRDDPQLKKMLWRSKKQRNIRKHLADKRKK